MGGAFLRCKTRDAPPRICYVHGVYMRQIHPPIGRRTESPPMARNIYKEGAESMLTDKQEAFVRNIIEGMNQADAYRAAYPKQRMSDKTIWEAASRLMKNDKVVARLKELRDELAKPSIMTAQDRLEWLSNIINSDEETTDTKLKASDQMNKMQGAYVTKIEGDLNVTKLEDVL